MGFSTMNLCVLFLLLCLLAFSSSSFGGSTHIMTYTRYKVSATKLEPYDWSYIRGLPVFCPYTLNMSRFVDIYICARYKHVTILRVQYSFKHRNRFSRVSLYYKLIYIYMCVCSDCLRTCLAVRNGIRIFHKGSKDEWKVRSSKLQSLIRWEEGFNLKKLTGAKVMKEVIFFLLLLFFTSTYLLSILWQPY
jgi:hypothetical protein